MRDFQDLIGWLDKQHPETVVGSVPGEPGNLPVPITLGQIVGALRDLRANRDNLLEELDVRDATIAKLGGKLGDPMLMM
jgi:hypothetical protein